MKVMENYQVTNQVEYILNKEYRI